MTMHSVCIIDDGIPTEQEELIEIDVAKQLDANTLRYLLREEIKWAAEEENLKSLIEKLIADESHWSVSAFKHPDFLMNSIKNDLVRPEIIVYDWEFHSEALDAKEKREEKLFNLLNESFAVVFIYSGADKAEEINSIIRSPRFESFMNRIKFIDKACIVGSMLSDEKLIAEVSNLRDSNFSFKFGSAIKQRSLEAVDKILVELGKATLNDVSSYLRLTEDTKKDLVDFIGERFRNRLGVMDLSELPDETEEPATTYDENLAMRLWAYRLYFYAGESDNIVRRGDIVRKTADNTDKLFLVISADCDLFRFWHKNLGIINLVTLMKLDSNLRERLSATIEPTKIKGEFSQTSLLSNVKCLTEGPFVLPFVEIEGEYLNYLVCPKEMCSVEVEKPARTPLREQLKKERLKYSDWSEYKRILTVSEPFLSPMIEHITKSLSGYGVPDYPTNLQETIKNISKEALR